MTQVGVQSGTVMSIFICNTFSEICMYMYYTCIRGRNKKYQQMN